MKTKKYKKTNTTPSPNLNSAWASSVEVIFTMQPSVHWLTLVGEGVVYKNDKPVNQKTCENTLQDASNFDHLQSTSNVVMSLHRGEDTSLFTNPLNISSIISINVDDKYYCFSSTPLYNSSNHEDVDEHIKFFYHGFHDLFSPSFDHNVDLFVVDLSKALSLMIYMLMNWKPHKMLSYFSLSLWLCHALALLTFIPLHII